MPQITLHGTPINTHGELPANGSQAPDFELTGTKLDQKNLKNYAGKYVILNIFPSVDTPTCAASIRKFNAEASQLDNAVVLCISKDLPFAQSRFCGAEGLDNVEMLSDFRENTFAKDYGVLMVDGPLHGLLSRALVVVDPQGQVVFNQQTPTIEEEPDYQGALAAIG